MSIPRLAIERPVTMFMLSGVIILIGAVSLARLPVDLMPDVSYPSITVRVGYSGVGPLEMEELVTRPIEQAMAAVAGLEGDFDRVKLREIAEHDLSQRLERVPGVAAVTVQGGLRRQIHVLLSKEKIRALDLPVDRVVSL